MRKNATGNVWIHYSISIIANLSTIFWATSKKKVFRYGYHKHCEVYPQEHCHDVPVQHPVKVNRNLFKSCAFTKTFRCHMKTAMTCQTLTAIKFLSRWNCLGSYLNNWKLLIKFLKVPQEKCRQIPKKECIEVPYQVPRKIPHEICVDIPYEKCHGVPEKVPKKIPRKVSHQVHNDTKTSEWN